MKDYFDNRINNIRAIAILIVLLGHSIIIYSPEWGIYVSSVSCNFFAWLKRLINIIQMPVFFSISGFLFKSSLMKRKPSRIVKSKVSRLILPYLMIGLFYMIPIRLLAKYPAWEGKALWKILFFDLILGYDNGHLWYLYVLFIFFLFGAIFRKLNRAVTACFFLFVLSLLSIFKPFSSLHPLLYQFENNFVWFYLGYLFSFYSEAFNTFHNRSYFSFLSLCC